MLSLFVVNANLAPAASREKQQQVTQAKALAQTRGGSPCGAVWVFFSFPFFCLACASSIYFPSEVQKTDRLAWRGGAGPPSSLPVLLPPHPVGGPGCSPDPQTLPCPGCLPARSLSPDRVTVPVIPLAWMVSEGSFCPQLLPKDEQRPRAQDQGGDGASETQVRAGHAPDCRVGLACLGGLQRVPSLGRGWLNVPGPWLLWQAHEDRELKPGLRWEATTAQGSGL